MSKSSWPCVPQAQNAEDGVGLGLSIIRKIVDALHGKFTIFSEKDSGSTFTVELPLEVYKADLQEDTVIKPLFEQCSALVVDDIEFNCIILKKLLEQLGLTVTSTTSSKEALTLAESNEYDLFFLDINMPEIDGIETMHQLKCLPNIIKNSPVFIAVTANVMNGDEASYIAQGLDDYLPKPISISTLWEKLNFWQQYTDRLNR